MFKEEVMNDKQKGIMKTPFRRSAFAPLFGSFPTLFDEGFGEDFETVSSSNISLSEDQNNVYVEANLPGLQDQDIELTLDKDTLWIKGTRKESKEDEERKYYYKASRSFSYRVTLPTEIDYNVEPDANFQNGVIHVVFKKSAKGQPRKISINKT